jgi:hypothetical protein
MTRHFDFLTKSLKKKPKFSYVLFCNPTHKTETVDSK